MPDQFLDFVERYLLVKEPKCYRGHCDQTAKWVPMKQTDSSLVGAHVCPEGYVSRVVYFAKEPDPDWFHKFLEDQLGKGKVNSRNIRNATRHGWELGGNAEKEIAKVSKSGITEYYWTSHPRTDEEKKYGVFICSEQGGGCGNLFSKLVSDKSKLCPNCKKA